MMKKYIPYLFYSLSLSFTESEHRNKLKTGLPAIMQCEIDTEPNKKFVN